MEKYKSNNPFIYSDNNKRYLTLAYHNRRVFGGRIYKASLELGCLCPNIDGRCGTGGCTFCEGPSANCRPVREQLSREARRICEKNSRAKLLAYFQTGSNTYCNPEYLYGKCREVLKHPGVVGISIGTRADCISEQTADMLYSLSRETYLTVELGLQSVHDVTAERINRGHTYEQFLDGYHSLYSRGIRICVHLINSLPGESREMMIESAKAVGGLRPGAIKLHMLNILQGTRLAEEYKTAPFRLQSREEYAETVVKQLEYIPEHTVIERLTGDGIQSRIIAPEWAKDKLKTLVEIDKLQSALDSFQGKALDEYGRHLF